MDVKKKKKEGKGTIRDRWRGFNEEKKSHTYPIFNHGNLVSPPSRGEPVGDPDHGLDPFPGWQA